MTDITLFPIPSALLTPNDYPEFIGPATEWQSSETHLQARPVGGDAWTDVVALSELQGEPGVGTPGADGNTILSGDVDPTDEGVDGNFYINKVSWEIFGPKATTWPAGVSLKGADGVDGQDGEDGAGGDVVGPASSTDNAIARFDAETGKAIQGGTNAPTYSDTGVLTVAPAALTGSDALSSLEINQTWNTTGNPTALKVDVTNTASGAASRLFSASVGGDDKFRVDKDGRIFFKSAFVTTAGFVTDGSNFGFYQNAARMLWVTTSLITFDGGSVLFGTTNGSYIGKLSNFALTQHNSTNPQEYRLCGSYTSETNYQRLATKSLRQAITATSGATLVSTITIPKFSHLIGVTTRVTTGLGVTNGTTGYQIGDGTDPDLWGNITSTAVGTTTDAANFTAIDALGPSASDRTITLTAVGGNFDGTGVIEVCAFYLRAEAD